MTRHLISKQYLNKLRWGAGWVWLFFATVVFLTTFLYALPWLVASLAIALALLVLGPRRWLLLGAAPYAGVVGVWMALIAPAATGFEYAAGVLALTALTTATYSLAVAALPTPAPRDIREP